LVRAEYNQRGETGVKNAENSPLLEFQSM